MLVIASESADSTVELLIVVSSRIYLVSDTSTGLVKKCTVFKK